MNAEDKLPEKDDRLRVICDTREQRPWSFDPLRVVTIRRTLLTGDYSLDGDGLSDRVVLERKGLGDFVNTVIHGWLRFRKELIRLSAFDVAAIVVEADIGQVYRKEYESEALPSSVLGRTHGIFLDHSIPVFFWGQDRQQCADMVHRFLLLAWKKYNGR